MKRNQRVLSLILSLILIAGLAVTPTWAAEAAIPDGSAAGSFVESENAPAEKQPLCSPAHIRRTGALPIRGKAQDTQRRSPL